MTYLRTCFSQLQVCVVFGVRFYGPRNITSDPLVRAAFQRALYVSAGVAYINSRVASPDDEQLCGVNMTNTGGFRRRLSDSESLVLGMTEEKESEDAREDREADLRRMQVFGVSDFTVMTHYVEEMFRVKDESRADSGVASLARATPAPTTPDTNVYFSVISNVVGKSFLLVHPSRSDSFVLDFCRVVSFI
jgi:hypothetical protein